ncbi:hypothetical protein BU16DRAFT_559410 [Lophium mytilinum]|uniref:RING-type domain-containing protein n=1 Tax=Lophium mytilinum TaxID=390894 RepID=A0A6A6QYY2_9PEZI|nr:hypothetical protein BU16DRAFT_559410 [Lophium mytilinum]
MASVTPTSSIAAQVTQAMINRFLEDSLSYANNPNAALRGIDIFVRKVWAEPRDKWPTEIHRDVERTRSSSADILETFATYRENDSLYDQAARIPTSEMERVQGFLEEGVHRWRPNYNRIMFLALLRREQRPYVGLSSNVLRLTEDYLKNFNWHHLRRKWEPHVRRLNEQGRNIEDYFYEACYDGNREWPADKVEFLTLTNCFWQLIFQGVNWSVDGSLIPPAIFLMMGMQDELQHIRDLEEMGETWADERAEPWVEECRRDLRRDCTLIFQLLSRPLRKIRDDLAVLGRRELQKVRIISKHSFVEIHNEDWSILDMVTSPTTPGPGNCDICLEAHNAANWVKTNKCSHIFGRECLRAWFASRNTCPMCREVFTVPADRLRSEIFLTPRHDSPLLRPMLAFLAMCRTLKNFGPLVNEIFHHTRGLGQDLFPDSCEVIVTIFELFYEIMALSPELRRPMREFGINFGQLPG